MQESQSSYPLVCEAPRNRELVLNLTCNRSLVCRMRDDLAYLFRAEDTTEHADRHSRLHGKEQAAEEAGMRGPLKLVFWVLAGIAIPLLFRVL